MKRGFLNTPKAKKVFQPNEPENAVVKADGSPYTKYGLQYGKVNHENALPKDYKKPNFNVTIDAANGIIRSKRKTMVLVTVPPRGSPAAVDENDHTEWLTIEATLPRVFNAPGFPKPVPKPKGRVPLHEVRTTPNMGMGVFATRDIKAGELIFAERPLYGGPMNVNMLELEVPGATLSYESCQKILLDEYEKILEAPVSRMSEANRTAYKALMNSHTEDGSGPLAGVCRTNGYGVEEVFDGPGYEASNLASRYSFIGNVASRINHSCIPNVDHKFDVAAFAFVFRATTDIKSGEQLFYSYCETDVSLAVRRKQLAPYGIVCECRACANATPESDKFREEYLSRVGDFRTRGRVVLIGSTTSWPTDNDFLELLKFRETAINEGLQNRAVFQHVLNGLALCYYKKGMFGKVQELKAEIYKNAAIFGTAK